MINSEDCGSLEGIAQVAGSGSKSAGSRGGDGAVGMPTSDLQACTGTRLATSADRQDIAGLTVRPEHEQDEEYDGDDDDLDNVHTVAALLDGQLRLLAMSPWICAYGDLRAQQEHETANVSCLTHRHMPTSEHAWLV